MGQHSQQLRNTETNSCLYAMTGLKSKFKICTAVAGLVLLGPVLATASGTGGVEIATGTVQKIVSLLTGDLAVAGFLLIIVLGGIAWWITRANRAGEILGRTVVGAVIIFGATQIAEFFAFQGAVL